MSTGSAALTARSIERVGVEGLQASTGGESRMNKASNVALAIGAGYLLGRKRKLRLALVLASAAATGRVGGVAAKAIKRGGSLVGSSDAIGKLSPELGSLMSTMRGDLADAGKAAVQAAVSSRIESLTGSLHDRAEGLRSPAQPEQQEEEVTDEPDRDGRAERPRGRGRGETRPSARRDPQRPRRRESDDRGGGRPRRRAPEDGGETNRSARQSSADGKSRTPSARRRGK
ncbi:MAG: hypothetical protein ACTHJW_10745 [Streptosporangiaceae bacterium]